MMDLQAAIGIHQLQRVEKNWHKRQEIWARYQSAFAQLPIGLPMDPETNTRHAYHLYTIQIDAARCGVERDHFIDAMNAARIGTGVHYLALSEHPYYQQRFGWRSEQWPEATRLGRRTVSLPLSPALTATDVERIVEATARIIGKARQ
jgi:dTDP-4-amino-4,6-dideoxygalactose transaminase